MISKSVQYRLIKLEVMQECRAFLISCPDRVLELCMKGCGCGRRVNEERRCYQSGKGGAKHHPCHASDLCGLPDALLKVLIGLGGTAVVDRQLRFAASFGGPPLAIP